MCSRCSWRVLEQSVAFPADARVCKEAVRGGLLTLSAACLTIGVEQSCRPSFGSDVTCMNVCPRNLAKSTSS
jgi:hypothetical protein